MRRICLFICLSVLVLVLGGCAKSLYFGTATSVGLDVSGTEKIPTKVSFAYDRGEIIIIPEDVTGTPRSVFANLDSEWTWFSGFYVSQLFATGKAAEMVSDPSHPKCPEESSPGKPDKSGPLLFVTGTKLGIAIEAGQTDSDPVSLLVGYKRAELTVMGNDPDQPDIYPVFADMTIDSRDITTAARPEVPFMGGIRIKQKIATGKAALNAAISSDMRTKLRRAMYGSTRDAVERDADRTAKIDVICNRFQKLPGPSKTIYLRKLNDAFGKTGGAAIDPDPNKLKDGLGKLDDMQLNIAFQEMDTL